MKSAHSILAATTLAIGFPLSATQAAVLAEGPEGWVRGNAANDGSFASVYYGWDQFDAGTPGPFGNSTLDDSTPDVGVDPTGANVSQGNPAAYGLRSSTGNLYSGFQGDQFNLDIDAPNNGTAGSGSTTVFLTFIGNPASNRDLLPFSLSDGTNTFAPDATTDGLSSELVLGDGANQRIWAAEWRLAGNVNDYSLNILSDLAGGNGTDVAIDALTIDIAWTSSTTPLEAGFGNIEFIPEPSSGLLAVAAISILSLQRRRKQ